MKPQPAPRSALSLLAALALGSSVRAQTPAPAPERPRVALELLEATLPELQHALRRGWVTSEELTRAYLERIATYDDGAPFLNGILAIDPSALANARQRDQERAQGLAHGPLFGIPVLLKDNIDVLGMPTTAGSLALAESYPPDDAFLVQRLREAGAIPLGKATLTEFANFLTTGMPAGYSSLGGYGLNPYDPRALASGEPVLTPGGSSSGSGIAVAANLTPLAIGTETSGSILSPSSENGVVGIKPTVGLISRDGILPLTADQDTPGPLARTVRDAAILLGALAGHDPSDPATLPCVERGVCPADFTGALDPLALQGARIAVPHLPYWTTLSQPQRMRMRQAIHLMEALGATLEDPHEIPNQSSFNQHGICVVYPPPILCSTVLLYGFKRDLSAYLGSLGPDAPMHTLADIIAFNSAHASEALVYGQSVLRAADRMNTAPGSADTERYLMDRQNDLDLFKASLDLVFAGADGVAGTEDDVDALLYPSFLGSDAPARAGYPSICVPLPLLDPDDTIESPHPFGITFTGPAFSEARLIGLAYAFEQATHHRRPPLSTPALAGDHFPLR